MNGFLPDIKCQNCITYMALVLTLQSMELPTFNTFFCFSRSIFYIFLQFQDNFGGLKKIVKIA